MDCGRPRQVSELWAALVRTTGLSNLPPPGGPVSAQDSIQGDQSGSFEGLGRPSWRVRFRADPHEIGRFEPGHSLLMGRSTTHSDSWSMSWERAATRASVHRQPVTPDGTALISNSAIR